MSRPSPLADAAAAACLFFASALYFVLAGREATGPQRDLVGAAGFPRAIAVLAMVATAALVVRALLLWRAERERDERQPLWWRPWALVGITALYVATLEWLGFLAGTVVYMVAALVLLGFAGRARVALLATGATVALFAIFDLFLGVRLPQGFLVQRLVGG